MLISLLLHASPIWFFTIAKFEEQRSFSQTVKMIRLTIGNYSGALVILLSLDFKYRVKRLAERATF